MKRVSGILLAISSLPSEYGIGCFDSAAYRFVDWLCAAGQSCWQILPLGPTGCGDSPYQSFSSFAGNPYFISLEELVSDGLLTKKECSAELAEDGAAIDYGALYKNRLPLLRKAFARSDSSEQKRIAEFTAQEHWLSEYALFMAVKQHFGGSPLQEWDDDIRLRKPEALARYGKLLSDEVRFHEFLQYRFFSQWHRLKKYANERGISIIGDIPIYVSADSVEMWTSPQLFQLDRNNVPAAVAGCPPDGFAVDGQLWGNPLYDWEYHRKSGFAWWIERLAHCFRLYDVVRIDHFRGFDEYYSIPYGEKTARNGCWKKAYGSELFRAVKEKLGSRDIIAEDLGFVTDTVRQLVRECGFPNMKVLEFAFDSRDSSGSDHLPHNYADNCVAYTGTHDNQTIASWYSTISDKERQAARQYLCDHCTPDEKLHLSFIALIMRSRAERCIIPMQDWLGLTDKARMNVPSTIGGNWSWRLRTTDLSDELSKEISQMTKIYDRHPLNFQPQTAIIDNERKT